VSAQLPTIPDFFECGYREGVWLTEPELYDDFLDDIAFSEGDLFFLMFTTYHLGDEPQGERKNLIGVEVQYSENLSMPDIWGLKINKYVDLGTVRGRKEWRKMNKRGEFAHIEAVYGVGNVKYVGQCANFDELASDILKYVEKNFEAENLDADSAEVIRYFRPLEVPEQCKAWYTDGVWLQKEDFEINAALNLDYITPEMPGVGIVFTSSNFLTGNEAELGVFVMVYHELPRESTTFTSFMDFDAYPDEGEFRFLGFIGPHYQIPSVTAVETFLGSNDEFWETFSESMVDFFYADKINTFADLRNGIAEAVVGYENTTSIRKMNIFK
tara:strand:- start:1367 stop:2347 length:981 start_codon:yes stop_codon:yes gene_type:complete